MFRRTFRRALAALVLPLALATLAFTQQLSETVTIDAHGPTTPLPHFWEQMFGSGRAVLSMRESYRDDMQAVKKITDFKYVRFHAIMDDDIGVYDEDAQGNPVYNFSYVDQIYDGLLANGVRPFVEISFMPKKLASRLDYHAFWYKQIVSPPKDYSKWDALITAFAQHLVERYGIDEVSQWYFEVWNEPNIDFWTGRPAQQTYFELYDHTARALKAVNPRIRVGGPATAQAAWVDDMIAHAATEQRAARLRLHPRLRQRHLERRLRRRPSRSAAPDGLRRSRQGPRSDQGLRPPDHPAHLERVQRHLRERAADHRLHLHGTLAGRHHPPVRRQSTSCPTGPSPTSSKSRASSRQPFYGGYGIVAERGIPKPAFRAFEILHGLGDQRIAASENDVLATRARNGALAIALWNLVEPAATGPDKTFTLDIKGARRPPRHHPPRRRRARRHPHSMEKYGQPALSHAGPDRGSEESL